jgi:peptide/nickel transport system ATP-binding protein
VSLLTVDRLSVHFGERAVVDDVSFTLSAGDHLGVVGESGSGKTLTALSLIGLLPDSASMSGRVLMNDSALPLSSDRQMSAIRGGTIAMVFQEPLTALNPLMPVWRQIAVPLRLHHTLARSEARARSVEWCARVGLPMRAADAYPHQLSGGQRQRVGIAIALSCSPRLLIADEPTSALDVTVQREILDLILQLTGETNTSLVFISHDLAVVNGMTDQVLVMHRGRVVERGATREVFSRPQANYTARLVASARDSSAVLTRLVGEL